MKRLMRLLRHLGLCIGTFVDDVSVQKVSLVLWLAFVMGSACVIRGVEFPRSFFVAEEHQETLCICLIYK